MKVTCCLLLVVACWLLVLSSSQKPPFWGGNPLYTVKVKMLNDNPALTWNFTYFYDSAINAERYEHIGPQADEVCLLVKTAYERDDCTIIMSDDKWVYITYPKHNFCCKCTSAFGAIRYDWLQANSTYVGIETINNVAVTHWTKMGQYLNHYYSTVDKALPVRFFQLKKGNPKKWDFDLSTFTTSPIDRQKFKAPCTNECPGECRQIRETQSLMREE